LDGFVRFMEIVTADDNRPVTARQIFRAFDTDGNGKITAQELHDYAVSVGMDMSRSEADAMVQRAGKKGCVTFEQFETGVFTLKSKQGKQDADTFHSTTEETKNGIAEPAQASTK
jgi:Ca2+-binding EF-hand superfamily protein